MILEKILFVFDFDYTVIDDNSDLYCKRLVFGGKIFQEIEEIYSDLGWIYYMGFIFDYFYKYGVIEKQYRECMNEISLIDGMREFIEYVVEKGYECIIVFDANSEFIDYILIEIGFKNVFFRVYINFVKYDVEGRLIIEYYYIQDWCDLSIVNLCKG